MDRLSVSASACWRTRFSKVRIDLPDFSIIAAIGFMRGFIAASLMVIGGIFLLSCCGWQLWFWLTGKPPKLV